MAIERVREIQNTKDEINQSHPFLFFYLRDYGFRKAEGIGTTFY